MSSFISQRFSEIEPYVPGEQPQDMEYIKLNTNESPYPPSPLVIKALSDRENEKLRLYPDPNAQQLVNEISSYYHIAPEQVFVGNGSDEVLALIFMTFCDQDKEICFPDITYSFYPVYANLYGLRQNQIPVRDDFSVDVEDYSNCGKNVILANPNAPTAMSLPIKDIEKILKTNPDNLIIIDEAYVDFGGESCVSLIDKYDNLMVVQTFSKSRSLAGSRLGFAISSKEIIEDLNKIKFSFNSYTINRLSMLAGVAAVQDADYFKQCTKCIVLERESIKLSLKKLGFTVTNSLANFLFAKPPRISGKEYYLELKKKGILVRHFDKERISDYVRITIGTHKQMKKFIEATKEIIEVNNNENE